MTKATAKLLPCRTRYVHAKGAWSAEEPIATLPHRIAFYKRMAQKRPEVYRSDYTALRMVEVEVRS